MTRFEEGLRAVEEDPDYERWVADEIAWGRSVGWI